MKLVKDLNNVLMVVDEEAVNFFNQNDTIKKERIAIGIILIIVAVLNLTLSASSENLFLLAIWILFLITWTIYLAINIMKPSYPNKIPLSEIIAFNLDRVNHFCKIKIHTSRRSFVFKTKNDSAIDELITYLHFMGLTVNK